MKRGEIWWATLPAPRASEPGFTRPVLIIQSDDFNDSRIQTIIVAGLTSSIRRGSAPGNVVIPARESGLPEPSVVNVSQLISADRVFFAERVGMLPARRMAEVDAGLKLILALT